MRASLQERLVSSQPCCAQQAATLQHPAGVCPLRNFCIRLSLFTYVLHCLPSD